MCSARTARLHRTPSRGSTLPALQELARERAEQMTRHLDAAEKLDQEES